MAEKRSGNVPGDELEKAGEENMPRPEATLPGVKAVVGIGASAGGLEALEKLFANMPSHTGMAFVVITHLHPDHRSLLPELLAKVTELPVVVAASDIEVKADHIYIGPPGGQLAIEAGKLKRRERDLKHAPKMPVNYFLRSLAHDQQERAVGLILSGTGGDGTLGLREIKAQAGMVMVQEPKSAQYAGMPASALATGLVDFVLTPEAMPERLLQYVQAPHLSLATAGEAMAGDGDETLQEIFGLLRRHTGQDFSTYKSNTILRRIARRMGVNQIESYAQYVRYLQENTDEIDSLFRELLINVTSFFRDPDAWTVLASAVEDLVKSRPVGSSLRVWVPGCSSGEEVFSIAILLHECMQASERQLDVQIFGTDLDSAAIDQARAGLYEESVVAELSAERLKTYFVREQTGYRIRKDIRKTTIFAVQNVIMDPPFTQMDIVSCRNLLIYLNADIQKTLLPIFHYALKPDGLLFLGSSETIGSFSDLFEVLDKRWNIFRRRKGSAGRQTLPEFPLQVSRENERPSARSAVRSVARGISMQRLIERALLSRFVPASVIVNERGDILYTHGRTGAYLELSEGQPRANILEMARNSLKVELADAMKQAAESDKEVVRSNVRVGGSAGATHVRVGVLKLGEPEELRDLLLVSFRPALVDSAVGAAAPQREVECEERLEQMDRALKSMSEMHQATLEELENSNMELESTNEDLQSTNEELQSTNEELETSKEEMQSLNEELTTVNAELQSKVEDLSQASNDMQNLLNSTKIATVFLDDHLNIKRFTEQARELVMLRQEDIGRPISELASKLQHEDLGADCQNVLKTLVFKEAEVTTTDGAIYLMRIMPYRTATNAIDGLVLTFVDISRLKQTQKDLRHMSEVFQEGGDPVIIVNLKGDILELNESAISAYGYSRENMLGKPLSKMIPPARVNEVDALLGRCRDGEAIRDEPWTFLTRSGEAVDVMLSLTLLTGDDGELDGLAFVARGVSEE